MARDTIFDHEFVEYIPEELKENTIYVSMAFASVAHRCCCGCGSKIVTPLSPNDWEMTFDGETISLYPSIGNWSFECQSHYWIKRSGVDWASQWSQKQIDVGRGKEAAAKKQHFDSLGTPLEIPKVPISTEAISTEAIAAPQETEPKLNAWKKAKQWLFSKLQ